jgi:hypothetical protein
LIQDLVLFLLWVPGSGSGIRDEKISGFGTGMKIPGYFSRSLETVLWVRIFLTLDPGSWMEKFGSAIRDKHPGSARLHRISVF